MQSGYHQYCGANSCGSCTSRPGGSGDSSLGCGQAVGEIQGKEDWWSLLRQAIEESGDYLMVIYCSRVLTKKKKKHTFSLFLSNVCVCDDDVCSFSL